MFSQTYLKKGVKSVSRKVWFVFVPKNATMNEYDNDVLVRILNGMSAIFYGMEMHIENEILNNVSIVK